MERARRYKTDSFAAYEEIVSVLDRASSMTVEQIQALVAAALATALWLAHAFLSGAKWLTSRYVRPVTK